MGLTTNVVRGKNPERLFFLLHGYGADEKDLAQLMPYIDPDGRFTAVLPRGPYGAPPGYSWFHFGDPDLMASTLASSLEACEESFMEACDLYGMRPEEAVIGGFSQGAALALVLGLRTGERPHPTAVLVMSGFLPPTDRLTYDWESADLPAVLLQHGTNDPLIPVERSRQAAQVLAEHGVPVVHQTYPMEHQVALESVEDAKAWLDRVLAGERPTEPVGGDTVPEAEAEADSGPVTTVTAATFDREVLQSDTPVIVDFWAPWCQPCRMISPIVEQIARMRQGSYKVCKLNIDQAPEIAQRYEIQSIPLVALFRNGRIERRSLGVKDRPQLESELGMLVIP